MKSIEEIFYNLDKRCHKIKHYFPLYEKHFEKYIGKSPKILEIGIFGGGSIDLWLEYFGPGTTIVGIDINPVCKKFEKENVKIIIDSQSNKKLWKKFNNNMFDIVIDDGSHICSDQIETLECVFPLIKDNGIYWCEDTHTSYFESHGGGLHNKQSFIEYSKKLIDVINDRHTKILFPRGKNLLDKHIDKNLIKTFKNIKAIHFYDSIVAIDKEKEIKFEEVIVRG